ncbi:Uncharacterised protein [Mycobacteroides abscessus subsp. abscessus]|uniref:hypothetical protein n=1 Tax=Mycobacteroides abscessus TaxID=36809 RepID=UPI00092BCE02|nr:hypothetical protein [Mycobacteroides abscessus]SHR61770.1 Uncharacterised protein [Mycobacteroides abscessus subsp. abscessus]DAZ89920.1 TPA_asm: hypothetical protein PROPHIFSAT01-1_31 [Mycobacterium phage prophiFSAT01-1]
MTHPFTPVQEAEAFAWYAKVGAELDVMLASQPKTGPLPAKFIAGVMALGASMRPELKLENLIDLLVVAVDRLAQQRGTPNG